MTEYEKMLGGMIYDCLTAEFIRLFPMKEESPLAKMALCTILNTVSLSG